MLKILLVEDNKLNREMLSRRLERKGMQVLCASDGREAIDKATEVNPDLVLMDMSLPIVDGWEATRRLKASPSTRDIPVIALTAHAMVGDREKAMAAGCDDYETKPIDLPRLFGKIQTLVKNSGGTASPASVLIAAANESDRNLLGQCYRQMPGTQVTLLASPNDIANRVREQLFDLVVLEASVAGAEGVLSQIRGTFSLLDLPLIGVVSGDRKEDVVLILKAGANDCVTKPLDPALLLARSQIWLRARQLFQASRPAELARVVEARSGEVAVPRSAPVSGSASGSGVHDASTKSVFPRPKAEPPARSEAVMPTVVDAGTITDAPTVPGYQILGRLGRGGMGVVYKARHERMNRLVALKVIDKVYLSEANAIGRFYREVQAAASLSHPNIVLAYDAGQCGDTHYFAMEYIEGIDLGRWVRESGPLPVPQACDFMRQAALGLQHAHECGMVHRDIKPTNLLATSVRGLSGTRPWPTVPGRGGSGSAQGTAPTFTVKITDMGLALLFEAEQAAGGELTREGRVLGTADYMAPEQWLNPHKVDIRADLYSLGCTFYYVLTGRVPFPGDEPMEKMLKHHMEEPTPLATLVPGLPAKVSEVVTKLLAKKPEQRYQQPQELADALS